jgi:hypothetical protein
MLTGRQGEPWSATRTIVTGGIIVGSFDILFVIIYYGITRGTAALRVFQSVARGWFGAASFTMGWQSGVAGLFSHFFIAFCLVTVFYIASRRITTMTRYPLAAGAVYGLGVYLFMNFVVLPLSKAGFPVFTTEGVVTQLIAHMMLIGPSTGLIVRHGSRSPSDASAGTVPARPLPAS